MIHSRGLKLNDLRNHKNLSKILNIKKGYYKIPCLNRNSKLLKCYTFIRLTFIENGNGKKCFSRNHLQSEWQANVPTVN